MPYGILAFVHIFWKGVLRCRGQAWKRCVADMSGRVCSAYPKGCDVCKWMQENATIRWESNRWSCCLYRYRHASRITIIGRPEFSETASHQLRPPLDIVKPVTRRGSVFLRGGGIQHAHESSTSELWDRTHAIVASPSRCRLSRQDLGAGIRGSVASRSSLSHTCFSGTTSGNARARPDRQTSWARCGEGQQQGGCGRRRAGRP